MPRVDQGIPHTQRVAKPAKSSYPLEEFMKNLVEKEETERRLRQQSVDLLSRILEKLEEIRFGLVDNETGISNLLQQMKITNRRLEELIDKRH